jgi:hypothetical protein
MVAQGVRLDVAGTSTFRFNQFGAEASAFQQQWKAYFEPRVLDAATLTPDEYAASPSFRYVGEPAMMMVRRVAGPIAAMGLAGALLLWIGFRSYRGYSV